jgi:integrase/recombinase XerC
VASDAGGVGSDVARVAGSAPLVLVDGATPLRVESALFESMLEGWRRQQQSRRLSESIVAARERTVRRFAEFTSGWPWCWTPEQVENWISTGGWAHSTVRMCVVTLIGPG